MKGTTSQCAASASSREVCATNITIGNAPRQRPGCVLHVKTMTVDEIIAALKSTSAASKRRYWSARRTPTNSRRSSTQSLASPVKAFTCYRPTVWSKVIYAMQDRSQRTRHLPLRQEIQETLRFRRTAAGAIIRSRFHTEGQ